MVQCKITCYNMFTLERRAETQVEMRTVQTRHAACNAAGLPPNSPEQEGEAVLDEEEAGEKEDEAEAPELAGFSMEDAQAQFELVQAEEDAEQRPSSSPSSQS